MFVSGIFAWLIIYSINFLSSTCAVKVYIQSHHEKPEVGLRKCDSVEMQWRILKLSIKAILGNQKERGLWTVQASIFLYKIVRARRIFLRFKHPNSGILQQTLGSIICIAIIALFMHMSTSPLKTRGLRILTD